jgi:hypothetical protein
MDYSICLSHFEALASQANCIFSGSNFSVCATASMAVAQNLMQACEPIPITESNGRSYPSFINFQSIVQPRSKGGRWGRILLARGGDMGEAVPQFSSSTKPLAKALGRIETSAL